MASLHDVDYRQPVNWQSPLNRGLRGWWLATPERTRGINWMDLVAARPASLTRITPHTGWIVGPQSGRRGLQCANNGESTGFNTGRYAEHPDDARFDVTGPLTVSAWVYFFAVSRAGNSGIVAKWRGVSDAGGGINERAYALCITPANSAAFFVSINGSSGTLRQVSSTTAMSAGVWYHAAGVYRPSSALKMYLNGELEATNSTSIPASIFNAAANVQIGSHYSTQENAAMNGVVRSVRIQAAALTDTEVAQLYRDALANYPTTLRRRSDALFRLPAVAGFLPAWGANANILLQPGVA